MHHIKKSVKFNQEQLSFSAGADRHIFATEQPEPITIKMKRKSRSRSSSAKKTQKLSKPLKVEIVGPGGKPWKGRKKTA